jgi:hypothetical protein
LDFSEDSLPIRFQSHNNYKIDRNWTMESSITIPNKFNSLFKSLISKPLTLAETTTVWCAFDASKYSSNGRWIRQTLFFFQLHSLFWNENENSLSQQKNIEKSWNCFVNRNAHGQASS